MTPGQDEPRRSEVLRVEGVTKRFGTTLALDDVSLSISSGEIRALIGRNGAGKSTLISIITGLQAADAGALRFTEEDGSGRSPVACVYQKSTLVPDLTAAENIFIDTYPRTRLGLVDWKRQSAQARALLREWNCEDIVDVAVAALDPLQRKIVEICRALATGARILLLDEPTAGLDGDATRHLFERMAELRRQGITMIYVSHYLDEVFEVCESVTVVRDGRVVLTRELEGLGVPDLVDAMVGNARESASPSAPAAHVDPSVRPILEVAGLEVPGKVHDLSLSIRPGECVGLVGLDGSGIIEAAHAIVGLEAPAAGEVRVAGARVPSGSVRAAIDHGIGFLPEDRHASGFVPGMANEENATLTILSRLRNRLGLVSEPKRKEVYDGLSAAWEIKASSSRQATEELSGGNQQKVALARAFASQPAVLVLANPTAGVDVSAKASIVESIGTTVRERQTACLIVSSDESEFGPCSRVLVLFRGALIGELTAPWAESVLASAVQGDLNLTSGSAA